MWTMYITIHKIKGILMKTTLKTQTSSQSKSLGLILDYLPTIQSSHSSDFLSSFFFVVVVQLVNILTAKFLDLSKHVGFIPSVFVCSWVALKYTNPRGWLLIRSPFCKIQRTLLDWHLHRSLSGI